MNDTNLQTIKDLILKNENIGIAVGKNPNLDEMAAALALYLALKQSNKNIVIACPTQPIVEISSLVGIDKVQTNLGSGGGDLVVSFPYKEGEIDKVSYTLENGYLNIIVKAGENGLSFSEKEISYQRGGNLPTLLFIVGTPTLSSLGSLFDPEALRNTTVVNIDNKQDNQGFGDVVIVSPKFSSVSEQITNLLNFLGFNIDIDTAQNLLSGITFATNNFQDAKTSLAAFEMAAILMKKGAIRSKIPQTQAFSTTKSLPQEEYGFRPTKPLSKPQQPRTSFKNPPPPSFPKPQPSYNPPQSNMTQSSGGSPFAKQDQPKDDEEAPLDWLTPKIYKGSTNI